MSLGIRRERQRILRFGPKPRCLLSFLAKLPVRQLWARPAVMPGSGGIGPPPAVLPGSGGVGPALPWSLSSEFRQWPVLGYPLVFLGLHDVFKVFESELKIKSNSFFKCIYYVQRNPGELKLQITLALKDLFSPVPFLWCVLYFPVFTIAG